MSLCTVRLEQSVVEAPDHRRKRSLTDDVSAQLQQITLSDVESSLTTDNQVTLTLAPDGPSPPAVDSSPDTNTRDSSTVVDQTSTRASPVRAISTRPVTANGVFAHSDPNGVHARSLESQLAISSMTAADRNIMDATAYGAPATSAQRISVTSALTLDEIDPEVHATTMSGMARAGNDSARSGVLASDHSGSAEPADAVMLTVSARASVSSIHTDGVDGAPPYAYHDHHRSLDMLAAGDTYIIRPGAPGLSRKSSLSELNLAPRDVAVVRSLLSVVSADPELERQAAMHEPQLHISGDRRRPSKVKRTFSSSALMRTSTLTSTGSDGHAVRNGVAPGTATNELVRRKSQELEQSSEQADDAQSDDEEHPQTSQLDLFWFRSHTFILYLIQAIMFLFMFYVSLLLQLTKVVRNADGGALLYVYFVLPVVTLMLFLPTVIPMYTIIIHVGQLVDPAIVLEASKKGLEGLPTPAAGTHHGHHRSDSDHKPVLNDGARMVGQRAHVATASRPLQRTESHAAAVLPRRASTLTSVGATSLDRSGADMNGDSARDPTRPLSGAQRSISEMSPVELAKSARPDMTVAAVPPQTPPKKSAAASDVGAAVAGSTFGVTPAFVGSTRTLKVVAPRSTNLPHLPRKLLLRLQIAWLLFHRHTDKILTWLIIVRAIESIVVIVLNALTSDLL